MKKRQIFGLLSLLAFVSIIFIVSFVFVKNFNSIINDPSAVRDTIKKYGTKAYLIYFFLYIFQIFFSPLPGQVLNVASGMLFGTLKGFLISWFAVISGGFLVMFVVRKFGKKSIRLLLGERALKFEELITRRGLPLILFLAIFPNPIGDGLFYIAGLTNIPIKFLIIAISICRIPGILIYVIAGDKVMSAGIKGWIIGGVGFLLALIFYFLFRKKIERFFERYIKKLSLSSLVISK